MQSPYKRSWFPGIGAKPLESIRIGCEPSPAQSRLFFCKLFHLCARTRPRVCSLKLGTNKPPKVKTNSHQKKTKTISDFFVIPESMSRYRRSTSHYRRSTSQYRRSTSQHGRSTSCPRVVLGSLCFQHAIFYLAEILWMFLKSWLKLPSACSFPRKIYIVVFLLGICGQSKGVLAYPIIIPWASILVYPGITLRPLPV